MKKTLGLLFIAAAAVIWMGAQSGTEIRRGGGGVTSTTPLVEGYYLGTDGTNTFWTNVVASATNALAAYVMTNNDVNARVFLSKVLAPNILYSNIVVVDATNANPLVNGTRLTNAIATSIVGSRIKVGDGTYYVPTNLLSWARSGISIEISAGAYIGIGDPDETVALSYLMSDQAGAVTNFIFKSDTPNFYVTNGHGDNAVWYGTNANSVVVLDYDTIVAVGESPTIHHLDGTLYHISRSKLQSTAYDAILGAGVGFGTNCYHYFKGNVVLGGDSIMEPGYCPQIGMQVYEFNYGEGKNLNVPNNVLISPQVIKLTTTDGAIYGNSTNYLTTGSGILQGCVIIAKDNATVSPISAPSPIYNVSFTLKDAIIYGPTNRDAIDLSFHTSSAQTNLFSMQNVTIIDGWGATNSIRSSNHMNHVPVYGFLNHRKPIGTNNNIVLTQQGTNALSNIRFHGTMNGPNLTLSGALTADAVNSATVDTTGDINGGSVIVGNYLSGVQMTASRVAINGPDGLLTNAPAGSAGQYLKQNLTWDTPAGSGSSNYVVLSAGDIDGTNKVAFNTVVANQYLHAAVITNHTAEPLAVGSGVLRIEGSNQFYFINVLSNITINSGTSVLLRSNVTYGFWVSNTTYTVGTEATWQWKDGATLIDAPSLQNGAYFVRLRRDFMGTNAWVETGRKFGLVAGLNTVFGTNTTSGLVTNSLTSLVTNLSNVKYAIQLPAITVSNLFISFDTNNYELVGLTNVVLTNIVEEATGVNSKLKIVIRNTLGVSVPLILPAFGAQHGYYFHTNGFNDILTATVAPPGTNTVVSLEADGTNVYPTITYWRHP